LLIPVESARVAGASASATHRRTALRNVVGNVKVGEDTLSGGGKEMPWRFGEKKELTGGCSSAIRTVVGMP
jgi:hypothetical protein